ncbi:MAG: hypothetical protein HY801_05535 [Candidatus Lindowbacteria bacterium]|nr:hypothetical protein [Candidatus Lindowbacteria bacterium]
MLAKISAKTWGIWKVELESFLKENCYLPQNETAAISYSMPKTTALCYDRVWDPIGMDVPDSCRFSGTTGGEFIIVYAVNWILNQRHQLLARGSTPGTSVFSWHTDLMDVTKVVGKRIDAESEAAVRGATDYLPGKSHDISLKLITCAQFRYT